MLQGYLEGKYVPSEMAMTPRIEALCLKSGRKGFTRNATICSAKNLDGQWLEANLTRKENKCVIAG